jgi:hypothetical protein
MNKDEFDANGKLGQAVPLAVHFNMIDTSLSSEPNTLAQKE